MARLDHLAYRVSDKDKAVRFFIDAFGYKFQTDFEIFFNDEKTDKALCAVLEPPEKKVSKMPFHHFLDGDGDYHMAPELFVSQGTPGSIVDTWVKSHGNGIHHLAYEVEDVEKQRQLWIEKGLGDFTSDKPFKCDGLTQIFTKPLLYTGVIYEFIERTTFGFCKENVKSLMTSTIQADVNIP